MNVRKTAVALVLSFSALGLTACGEPSCPAGFVVEYDDDGYECESDQNRNGVEDEEEGGEDASDDSPTVGWTNEEDDD